jgi:hypothetical protein
VLPTAFDGEEAFVSKTGLDEVGDASAAVNVATRSNDAFFPGKLFYATYAFQ